MDNARGCRAQDAERALELRVARLEARVERLEREFEWLRAQAWAGQQEDRREVAELRQAVVELARTVVGSELPPAVARLAGREPAWPGGR